MLGITFDRDLDVQGEEDRLRWVKGSNVGIRAEIFLAPYCPVFHTGPPISTKQFQKSELAVKKKSHLPRLSRMRQATI